MRYIRTKNGIYEKDKTNFEIHTRIKIINKRTNTVLNELVCHGLAYNNEKENSYFEDRIFAEYCVAHKLNPLNYRREKEIFDPNVIAEADTIDELCDEFDWKWNEKEFPYSKVRQHSRYGGYGDLERAMREEENYGKHLNHDYEIYGAIWTDKGLIYVAKMNNKGVLELL